jgi:hypothetical protein
MSKINVSSVLSDIVDSYAFLQVDYNGNIYIQHLDKYYMVSLDNVIKSGIELTLMINVERFKKNFLEFNETKKIYKYKKVMLDLYGKAIEKFNELDDGEKCDFNEINDNHHHDPNHIEKKYYKIDKDVSDLANNLDNDLANNIDDDLANNIDDNLDNNLDDGFNLCGNFENGMILSDMLSLYTCSFETVLIEGENNVLASTEKILNDCYQRITIYLNGTTRVNFIDKVCMGKIMYDGKTLFIQ